MKMIKDSNKQICQKLTNGTLQMITFDEFDGEIIKVDVLNSDKEPDNDMAEIAVINFFEKERQKHTVGGWRK